MIYTVHEKITVYEVAGLFKQAYTKVATMVKGIYGFRAASLFSFNSYKFNEEVFAPVEEFRELAVQGKPAEVETSFKLFWGNLACLGTFSIRILIDKWYNAQKYF